MARLYRNETQKADDAFRKVLQHRQVDLNIRSQRELSERLHMPQSTISKKLRDPGSITVAELRQILDAMGPAPDLALALLNIKMG